MAVCTEMACSTENSCCNSCGSNPTFDNINLVGGGGVLSLGCGGSNCDYMDNCAYNNGDNVLVYGTVDRYGWTIIVDQHCLDPNTNTSAENIETITPSTPTNQAYTARTIWIVLCNGFLLIFILCNI